MAAVNPFEIVHRQVSNLRPKLLDLSRRNPLLAAKLSPRSNAHIRVVDELPDVLFYRLNNGQKMRLVPLPDVNDDPRDETTKDFLDALAAARLTDEAYLQALEAVERDTADYLDRTRSIERVLKDRVRDELGMPARAQKVEINLAQHARNNGITPSYDLPLPSDEQQDDRHTDNDIQTLLLPKDLERKLNAINSKCRTWVQETGINVLHLAYGFLEWSEPNQTETAFAPVILAGAEIEKRRTQGGSEFIVSGSGEDPELNPVLIEKLRSEFHIELPSFEGGSIETYLASLAEMSPKQLTWRLRRQVAIGIFPSARMAMYHDIDPDSPSFPESDILEKLLAGSEYSPSAPFAEEYEVDEPSIEQSVPYMVMDADSSQVSTLVDVAKGKNLAVEGPPGTGKSQTIVNAIAGALAEGKKVLFVAEKLAALNVVRARLEAVGLGEFLLPLQAERSAREQVIQSIRDRAQMAPPQPVRDYEQQIREFREVRSQLASYIDLLKSPFDSSGLTVQEILNGDLARAPRLDGVPPRVLEECALPAEFLGHDGFERLKEAGDALAIAAKQAAAANQYWKGTRLEYPDRFVIERACDVAAEAAEALRALNAALDGLRQVDVPDDLVLQELWRLLEALRGRVPLGGPSPELELKLFDPDARALLFQFIADCETCAKEGAKLSGVLQPSLDAELLGQLRTVHRICLDGNLPTLDLANLESRIATRRKELEGAIAVADSMKPLARLRGDATHWGLQAISKAHDLIAAAAHSALLCRNSATGESAALPILKRLVAEGRALVAARHEISQRVSLSVDAPADKVSRAVAGLRAAGIFSFLSADYRAAKRLARSICLSTGFDRLDAIVRMEALVAYQSRAQAFLDDPQARAIFGVHFRGLETDFETFEGLIAYYEAVQSQLSGPEVAALRKFLREADLDALEIVPLIPADIGAATLGALETRIAAEETSIANMVDTVEKIRPMVAIFKNPAATSSLGLQELTDQLGGFLLLRLKLDRDDNIRLILGPRFRGGQTDTHTLKSLYDWASTCAGDASLLVPLLAGGHAELAVTRIEEAIAAEEAVAKLFLELEQVAKVKSGVFTEGRSDTEAADALDAAAADPDGLFAHATLQSALLNLGASGTSPFVEFRLQSGATADLGSQLEALAYRKLAQLVGHAYGARLARFPGVVLDQLRAKLAEKDRQIIKLTREHLRWHVHGHASPPGGVGVGKRSEWTEMALLNNEMAKQRRFVSVRDLTRRAAKALQELKPCWMMSPLAVAQYAPKESISFDVCIIDEASQMPPEAAVGALLRCKQVVVVGDTNQLPPSSFFKKMIDDEEDDDEDEKVLDESILGLANGRFHPRRRLRWHYRSRHSGLIRFSNRLIYDDDLIVFPSATESMQRMGVEYRKVPGLYKSGTNAIEAQAMVEAILHFMRTDPDRSLGVVTLNQKQRDLIAEEFEDTISRDRVAQAYVEVWKARHEGLEEFFIKNLENVQGDERDVIFIGTVYGPESADGKVAQRFGPINGVAGKRRLNVLFSRAKEKIVTFSSMTAADVVAEETGNPGTYMLKCWLNYVANGTLDAGKATDRAPDSDFELFVMDQIKAMGCVPVPQVGVAGYFVDIGIKHPDWPHGYLLGVECDGASYHSAKSARDRDRLRQEVMERLGWRFHRIWSTDWFNNPRSETQRLREVILNRLAEVKAKETITARGAAQTRPDAAENQNDNSIGAKYDNFRINPISQPAKTHPPSNSLEGPKRIIGKHPKTNDPVTMGIGALGPYINWRNVYAPIPNEINPESVGLDLAIDLIAANLARKPTRKPEQGDLIFSPTPIPPNQDLLQQPQKSVAVGDTVRVRYLDGKGETLEFLISLTRHDIADGIVNFQKPLAQALIDKEEGEEVEVMIGVEIRPALIEKISKPTIS